MKDARLSGRLLAAAVLFAVATFAAAPPLVAQSQKLRFGVGPLQPTPSETKKAFEPFFADLAKRLNREYDLVRPPTGRASPSRSPTIRSTWRGWDRGGTCSPTTTRA